MGDQSASGIEVVGHDGSQLIVEMTGTSEAIAAVSDPGAFRGALEQRCQQLAAVGAEDIAVAAQYIGKISGVYSSCSPEWYSGLNCGFVPRHMMVVHEVKSAIEQFSGWRGVESDAGSAFLGKERLVHQLRSDSSASLLRIHDHHGDPGE